MNVANEPPEIDLTHVITSIIPVTSLIYSLGTTTNRFKDIFVGPGTINIDDAVTGQNASITVANGVFLINGITQAQLPNIYVTNLTFHDNTVQTTAAIPMYNGSFEDTTTQISAGTTSATLVTMNTTTTTNGISIDTGLTNSKIRFANAGVYFFVFNGQFMFSGGASNYNVTVWYAKNGTIVSNTAYTYTLTSAQNSQVLGTVEDIITVNADDYIQFYWWTSVAPSNGPNGIYLYSAASGTNPTRPASPSVNLNVYRVG